MLMLYGAVTTFADAVSLALQAPTYVDLLVPPVV